MSCGCIGKNTIEVVGLCPDPQDIKIVLDDVSGRGAWTQLSIPEVFLLPCDSPNIETIDKVFVDVKIVSVRNINTPVADTGPVFNRENTRITGKKLVIEGALKQKVVYTASISSQPVHAVHFDIPFSAFIVLPSTADANDYCVQACVEDVFAIQYNCREIFKNVTLFLQAIPFSPCLTDE